MKRMGLASLLAASVWMLFLLSGCEWNVPNEDTEKEQEVDCALNPSTPGYDCGDACCTWQECGPPALYLDYNDCVARCDEALYIFIADHPNFEEGYKNCILDCIASCGTRWECLDECQALFED